MQEGLKANQLILIPSGVGDKLSSGSASFTERSFFFPSLLAGWLIDKPIPSYVLQDPLTAVTVVQDLHAVHERLCVIYADMRLLINQYMERTVT